MACASIKKRHSGSSTPWIMAQGALVPGYSVVVRLQPAHGCPTQSHISQIAACIPSTGMHVPKVDHKNVRAWVKPLPLLWS